MKDTGKSPEQLLEELKELRHRLAELQESEKTHERTEKALRESEERLEKIAAVAWDAIVIADQEGNVSFWNQAAERMFGYSKEEAIGQPLHSLIAPPHYDRLYKEEFARYRSAGEEAVAGRVVELTARRKDGTLFPVEASLSTVKIRGWWNTVAIIRDVTERQQAEARQTYYLQMERVLSQISARFVEPSDPDEAIRETLRAAGTVLNASRAYLFRIHDGGGRMSNTHEWVDGGTPSQQKLSQDVELSPLTWWTEKLRAQEVIAVSDIDQLPPPERRFLKARGARSILCSPLYVHGTLYGFFSFDDTVRSREWEREEIGFLRNVAQILSRALERAQSEEAVRRRSRELSTLHAIAQTLSSSMELSQTLDQALSYMIEALDFDAGLICLSDEHTGELVLFAHRGLPLALTRQLQATGLAGTPCEAVYRMGRPLTMEGLGADSSPEVIKLLEAGFRAYLGVPICHKDRPVGTIGLFDTGPHTVSEDDQALLIAVGRQIGIAVENARLFEAVAREREIARTLLNTATALSRTLQLDKLLDQVLDELRGIVPYDAALIGLVRGDTCWFVASQGMDRSGRLARGFRLEALPLVQETLRRQEPLTVEDLHADPAWCPFEEAEPFHAWLGVPLVVKERPIGVLVTLSRRAGAYNQEQARFAAAFGNQVALAIENARLYERTRAQLQEANLLRGFAAALSATLEEEQILAYVARHLCEALNGTSVEIYGLDEERDTCTIIAEYMARAASLKEQVSELGQTYPLSDYPATVQALADRQPLQVQVEDPRADPQERADLEAYGAYAKLILPMVARDRVLGFAEVWESGGPRQFTESEIGLGQTLVNQAAVALEGARLFAETQRRVRELQLLHNVSLAAASGLHLRDVLQAAAEALAAALEGSCVAVMLLEPESQALRLEVGVGYPPETVRGLRLPAGEGITGWVAQTGEPVLVPDVRAEPRYFEADPSTRSELCVPLVVDQEVIGVINVESVRLNAFTPDDQRLMSTLAGNLAVLIQRARLFDEVEAARAELQERAKALEDANIRLQELDRLKSQFLATMSHELRTPLNSIIGFSEVLMDGLVGDLTPEQKECVQDIHSSGQHLLALINDILDLSKIEAGRMKLSPTAFDVKELLAEVQATVAPLIAKKSQLLTVQYPEELPPLTADRFRIKQVLLNLLSNAHKFTPAEGRITLSCRPADAAGMLFSVSDTGIGIRPEDQEIIFEEFRQAESTAPREMTGTGLGLAISKRLVEMHGGRIWVESRWGEGATFSFIVPLAGPSIPEGERSEREISPSVRKVMVVEDDRQFSNLLAFYLRQEGYLPFQHYSGARVVRRAQELKPDLIMLDIMLPDRDGWEVLRALKSNPQTREIPVLIVSALEDRELAFSLGAVEFMTKPVDRGELRALLRRLIPLGPAGGRLEVLVIDDDPALVPLLQEFLRDEPFTLLAAYDGEEGLSVARSERPGAILLDLLLPKMSGFEVLEALRADPETAGIPITVLTAIDVTPEERKALDEHIQGLMRKSALSPQSLLEELRRLEKLAHVAQD